MINNKSQRSTVNGQQFLRCKLWTVIFFIMMTFVANCQTVESLENKIQSIQKDIRLTEKLLKETSKDKEASINQVNLLQAQISQRESLIKTYQNQINTINKNIQKNKDQIASLEKDLSLLRKDYSNLLVINYRNKGKTNSLLFIFSSEDFNQAMRRMRYIQELNGLVKEKIEEIDSTQIKINLQLKKNEKNKKDKEAILAKEKQEKSILLNERDKLNKDIASLKKKEKQIQKDINAKEKQTKELEKQIEKIIAEEVRKVKERELTAKKNNTKAVDINLSNDFAQNKGKLPFPVDQGIITRKYGLNQHPTIKDLKTTNNGIDISTPKGSKAKSIFNGEVCIVNIQGNNNTILIRHGLYFSLYSNLEKVFVKVGDKVSTGQEIGRIHTNINDGKTILHFELWHENKTKLNPSLWLKK